MTNSETAAQKYREVYPKPARSNKALTTRVPLMRTFYYALPTPGEQHNFVHLLAAYEPRLGAESFLESWGGEK